MSKYVYIGAAWKKKNKKGETFLSFSIKPTELAKCPMDARGSVSAALYPNSRKESDKHPDYNLVVTSESARQSNDEQAEAERQGFQPDDSLPF